MRVLEGLFEVMLSSFGSVPPNPAHGWTPTHRRIRAHRRECTDTPTQALTYTLALRSPTSRSGWDQQRDAPPNSSSLSPPFFSGLRWPRCLRAGQGGMAPPHGCSAARPVGAAVMLMAHLVLSPHWCRL